MDEDDRTTEVVRRKAERIERARRSRPAWRHLATIGVLGWMFVLPLLLFAYLGHFVTQRTGELWPAVAGVGLGLAAGAYLAWRQLRRELGAED